MKKAPIAALLLLSAILSGCGEKPQPAASSPAPKGLPAAAGGQHLSYTGPGK